VSVCIGNINPGQISTGFVLSREAAREAEEHLPRDQRVIQGMILQLSGPYLDIGRNKLTEKFVKDTDCEWLLMVDSDIVWSLDDVRKLVSAADHDERPVVSGIYYSPFDSGTFPVVYRWGFTEVDGEKTAVLVNDNWDESKWPEDDIMRVDSFGAGFMLISRRLLEKMVDKYGFPAPWFLCQVVNGTMMGEDHLFCLRVAHMGYSLYIHTGVRLKHRKAHLF